MENKTAVADPHMRRLVEARLNGSGFAQSLGVEIEIVSPGNVNVSLAYGDQLSDRDGCFHEGVLASTASVALDLAAGTIVGDNAEFKTAEYKFNNFQPACGHRLLAKSHIIKSGRTLVVAEADLFSITTSGERHVATVLATLITV
ncbi:PaaI family thioesterase [Sneathiella glossodoripedis]|uniref:PaaI family thioesterase n=1 Tax=Sneathiella glossodoripedis TaxID=418853 RepID=UPI0011DE37FE|nr:PaaI family thioesterase [Sneathiella glossodoripedis]